LNNDQYLLLADYASYIETQDKVAKLYHNQEEWTRMAILNVASMAKFSSDRAISDYAKNIWHVNPSKAESVAKTKTKTKVAKLKKVV
jgi:starch phosphorylase